MLGTVIGSFALRAACRIWGLYLSAKIHGSAQIGGLDVLHGEGENAWGLCDCGQIQQPRIRKYQVSTCL